MNKITCNAELLIPFPDGFNKLDEEVKRRMGASSKDQGEMVSDPDRHMLVSIGWRPLNLAARLNGVKDLMKAVEKGISKDMQPFGYKFVNSADLDIDGELAECFNYEYTAEEIDMIGQTIVIKRNKLMYNIHLYARKELKEASLETWKEILDSIKWV
ncbi:MAG: hypothetical protein J6Q41_05710 [Firmicutes bacterium]|nr:hypothetical protein [Bacillota bacterium]